MTIIVLTNKIKGGNSWQKYHVCFVGHLGKTRLCGICFISATRNFSYIIYKPKLKFRVYSIRLIRERIISRNLLFSLLQLFYIYLVLILYILIFRFRLFSLIFFVPESTKFGFSPRIGICVLFGEQQWQNQDSQRAAPYQRRGLKPIILAICSRKTARTRDQEGAHVPSISSNPPLF